MSIIKAEIAYSECYFLTHIGDVWHVRCDMDEPLIRKLGSIDRDMINSYVGPQLVKIFRRDRL